MGFLGSIRKLVLRTFRSGKYDLQAASEAIVAEARRTVKTADVSGFFSPRYLREVDNVPRLGETRLFDFVRYSREGNFERSFGAAFPSNAALNNRQVRNTVNSLLLESRRTLPDFRMAQNDELLNAARRVTGVDTKRLNTIADVEHAVSANKKLGSETNSLLRRVNRTKKLHMFGLSFTLAGGALTAYTLFQYLQRVSAENSGCFAYWTDSSGNVRKCKVAAYSCSTANKGVECSAGMLPREILDNKDCQLSDNETKLCLHCSNDDPVNAALPDNVTLRCEEHTIGDVLIDAITNTVGNVWTGITGTLRTVFIWGAVALVIVIVLVIIVNFLR